MAGQAVKTHKGQASIEMLSTVGIVLLLLLPLLMLLLVGAQVRFESLSQIQASSVARIIADSINEVYLEGKGATQVALVNIPSNTKSITFSQNEVIVSIETSSGPTQITYPFFGRVSEATLDLNITDRRGLMPITFYVAEDEEKNAVVTVDYANSGES
ncbi:hypothetical protein H0O01_04255 [Candidatus Micrarchaeota archaeon]|nr:hypothetical protein [Candidatus Micrarchaeota archaeon]